MVTRRFPADYPDVMDVKDLAELLQVSVKRIYQLRDEGALTSIEHRHALGRITFARPLVEAWHENRLVGVSGIKPSRRRVTRFPKSRTA